MPMVNVKLKAKPKVVVRVSENRARKMIGTGLWVYAGKDEKPLKPQQRRSDYGPRK